MVVSKEFHPPSWVSTRKALLEIADELGGADAVVSKYLSILKLNDYADKYATKYRQGRRLLSARS